MHIAVLTGNALRPVCPYAQGKADGGQEPTCKIGKVQRIRSGVRRAGYAPERYLTIAAVAANTAQADSIMDTVLNFIESNTEAQVMGVEREIR